MAALKGLVAAVVAFVVSFFFLGLLAGAIGALGGVEVLILLAICTAISVVAGRRVYRRSRVPQA
ncbi:MAG: hypothetical protein S0880_33620 [Actinomycetota bacterium]|nr:hypothetical protein [Actinomycetota bacterium]